MKITVINMFIVSKSFENNSSVSSPILVQITWRYLLQGM